MKKTFLFIAGFVGLITLTNAFGNHDNFKASVLPVATVSEQSVAVPVAPPQVTPTAPAPTVKAVVQEKEVEPTPSLSNDNHYTNVSGNEVHSPAYSNTVPSGASAICRDGTYSFSQHRRGTCSHHGGVDEWL